VTAPQETSAAELLRLLELADDRDRAGDPESALSLAEEAFRVLREGRGEGFVLSATIALAFCLRLRERRGIDALVDAIDAVVDVLGAALEVDPPADGSYDAGLELLAQLYAIAGTARLNSRSAQHLRKAAAALETRRALRRRLDGPHGSVQLVATHARLATVFRQLERWSEACSAATDAVNCMRELPIEPAVVAEVKSCLDRLVRCLETVGCDAEARGMAALRAEIASWCATYTPRR
jgi:hypothetical protein